MPLVDKIEAWLELDEPGGPYANSHTTGATYDLAAVNTPTQETQGGETGMRLARGDISSALGNGTNYAHPNNWTQVVRIWNAGDLLGVFQILVFKNFEAWIDIMPDGILRARWYSGGTNFTLQTPSPIAWKSAASPGWDNVFFWRDHAALTGNFQVNDGTIFSVSLTGSQTTNANGFYLGYPGAFNDCLYSKFVRGHAVWDASERAEFHNAGAEVTYDDIFAQPPAAPTALTATATASTKIALAWVDNSDDETGFKVERSLTGAGGWSLINTTAANATTYTDTSLTPGVKYYYRVAATNAEGDSAYTSTANATTLIGEPTLVLTETRPTLALTETRPTLVLTETRPTLVLTEL